MSSLDTGKPFIQSLNAFSDEALQELRNYFEINPPSIPVANILGFSQFTAQQIRDVTESQTNSTTYADPNVSGTTGPALTGLPDGEYVFLYGASMPGTAGGSQQTFANLEINGSVPPDDTNAVEEQNLNHSAGSTGLLVTLSGGGNNTVKMVYRVPSGATVDVRSRWIIALRVAAK